MVGGEMQIQTEEHFISSVEIRIATTNDLDWALQQLQLFSAFYKTKNPLFGKDEYAKEFLLNLMTNHVFLVAEQDSLPIGLIAGLLTPHFFNPETKVLAELFWWVQEEHRGGRAGYLLFKEFVEIGKQKADWITVALEADSPVSDEAILKRGFTLKEKNFLMETH
jgi:hypothetical protein